MSKFQILGAGMQFLFSRLPFIGTLLPYDTLSKGTRRWDKNDCCCFASLDLSHLSGYLMKPIFIELCFLIFMVILIQLMDYFYHSISEYLACLL